MLIRLTSRAFGKRAASFFVVLYGLCVLMPAAAIAFGDAAKAAHCLTGDHHSTVDRPATPSLPAQDVVRTHVHVDGAAHDHEGSRAADEENASAPNCCGLMCLPAIPAAAGVGGDEPLPAIPAVPRLRQNVAGCGPDLLYRPPISSLSL